MGREESFADFRILGRYWFCCEMPNLPPDRADRWHVRRADIYKGSVQFTPVSGLLTHRQALETLSRIEDESIRVRQTVGEPPALSKSPFKTVDGNWHIKVASLLHFSHAPDFRPFNAAARSRRALEGLRANVKPRKIKPKPPEDTP